MDAPKQQTRLKVVLLSLPARTQAVLEFFFTSTGRSSFAPVTEDSADAAIFDLDTLESRQHWLNFHNSTGRPGIALSVQPQAVEGAVWVQKPVTPAALLTAAAELHAGRWVRPAADASAAPPAAAPVAGPVVAPVAAPIAAAPMGGPAEAADPAAAARAELARAISALPEPAAVTPAVSAVDVPRAAAPVAATPPAAPVVPPAPPASEPAAPAAAPAATTVPTAPTRPAPVTQAAPTASPPSTPRPAAALPPPAPAAPASSVHKPAKPAGLGGLLRRFFGGGAAPSSAAPTLTQSAPARTAQSAAPAAVASPAAKVSRAEESTPAPATSSIASPAVPGPVAAAPTEAVVPAAPPVAAQSTAPATAPAPAAPVAEAVPVTVAPVAAPTEAPVPPAPSDDAAANPRDRLLGNASSAAAANDALLCGSAEDLPDHLLAEDPERRYDPEVNLVSVLREAYLVGAKWQVPTQLECSAGRIVVDTTRNLVLCDFDASRLEDLFKRPLSRRPKTRTLNRQEQSQVQEQAPHAQGVRRLDDSLWRAGLLTAAGRLPIDLDLSRPVYLKYWPNLTRVAPIPHAARVAALWSARGASITETAQTLGIPQRHVIAFYNGALALDLVTDDGSHIRRAQRKAGRNRGLLTRLLGWLNR